MKRDYGISNWSKSYELLHRLKLVICFLKLSYITIEQLTLNFCFNKRNSKNLQIFLEKCYFWSLLSFIVVGCSKRNNFLFTKNHSLHRKQILTSKTETTTKINSNGRFLEGTVSSTYDTRKKWLLEMLLAII